VISYQNGIGNEEFLAKYFGKDRAMRVAINYAGNVVGPGKIRMSFFHKPNHIGCMCGTSICGHAIELAELMTSVGLETEPTAEIKRLTWRKTILNAALSPVCAVLAQTMSSVMEFPPARELVEALLWESISVARAAGFDYGEGFFDDCVKYLATAGPHKPSMLVDIENGMPTEIDFINGKIASVGQELQVPVPLNTTMTALVKAREREN
jgi:2-dehydropantoate 2-reductase